MIAPLLINHLFRMNSTIMGFPSEELYEGRLLADTSVASHLLSQLPKVESTVETLTPILFIDTAGCGLEELRGEGVGWL